MKSKHWKFWIALGIVLLFGIRGGVSGPLVVLNVVLIIVAFVLIVQGLRLRMLAKRGIEKT